MVYGPADTLPALRAALARADGDFGALGRCLTAALGPRAGGVVGPAWYGYATRDATLPARRPAVRSLTMADLPLLTRLHQQTPPVEREESGTTGLPAFGYLEGGDLLSVAYLGM